MGYYVNGNGQLRIKAENLPAAYAALMALQAGRLVQRKGNPPLVFVDARGLAHYPNRSGCFH